MQKWQDVVLNQFGTPVKSATVTVRNAGLLTNPTIYSDNGTSTVASSQVVADAYGRYSFYAADGRYDLDIAGSGITGYTESDILLFDPAASTGSAGVGFLQFGSGALAIDLQTRNRQKVYVTDFAADGVSGPRVDPTGVVDSTGGIRAAIVYTDSVRVSQQVGGQGPFSGSKPTLFFPKGIYKITADLANGLAQNYVNWEGEDAIIQIAAGVTALSHVAYMAKFKGISFQGGAKAISVASANADTNIISFDRCEFIKQTVACIDVDNNSASTIIAVHHTKFYISGTAGAQVLKTLSGDYAVFRDCWVTAGSDTSTSIFDVTNTHLRLYDVVGVPGAMSAWVELRGSSTLRSIDTRFGGESPPDHIVINRASADTSSNVAGRGIDIQGGQAYYAVSLIKMFAVPNSIRVKGVTGNASNTPLLVADSTIPAADLAAIGARSFAIDVSGNMRATPVYVHPSTGTPNALAWKGIPLVENYTYRKGFPLTADLILQTCANTASYGQTFSNTNVTRTGVSDEFGVSGLQYAATAANATFLQAFTSAFSGLAAGIYTVVYDIDVTTDTVFLPSFTVSNTFKVGKPLPNGRHSVCIPAYYDGGAAQTVALTGANMENGGTVIWRRFRIYDGVVDTEEKRAIVIGSAAPTTGQWYKGDRVINSSPIIGGPEGWECTTAGTQGTWVPYGLVGQSQLRTTAVNLNSANTDVATVTGLPSKYIVRRVTAFDASTSLAASAATLGVFTAAAGGGTAVVADGTMTALSAATKFVDRTVAATTDYLTAATLYLRCGTAHGSAATCSVTIEIEQLVG